MLKITDSHIEQMKSQPKMNLTKILCRPSQWVHNDDDDDDDDGIRSQLIIESII
jgi:hypothetical protein